MIRRRR